MPLSQSLSEMLGVNLARLSARVAEACSRCERNPDEIRIVAVTKYARDDWVRALIDRGMNDLGESRPQQLADRSGRFNTTVRWHMIGHLQRNKVRSILPNCHLIHSVDSLRLLERIDRIAGELDVRPRLLLQVNLSRESTKGGFFGEQLMQTLPDVAGFSNVHIAGLMAMAPLTDSVEQTRPVFRGMRELQDRLRRESGDRLHLDELSFGMSRDFEIAIEEGATIIRIGSQLFQGLES